MNKKLGESRHHALHWSDVMCRVDRVGFGFDSVQLSRLSVVVEVFQLVSLPKLLKLQSHEGIG